MPANNLSPVSENTCQQITCPHFQKTQASKLLTCFRPWEIGITLQLILREILESSLRFIKPKVESEAQHV